MKTIVATGKIRSGSLIMVAHTTFDQALRAARDRAAEAGANIVAHQPTGVIILGRPVSATIEVALK